MTENETVSMTSQIYQSFALTRYTPHPTPLICTSFGGRVRDRMDGVLKGDYKKWKSIQFHDQSLQELLLDESNLFEREQVVYLTADSDNVLEEIAEGKIYVIGGIVDRNRYKVWPYTC